MGEMGVWSWGWGGAVGGSAANPWGHLISLLKTVLQQSCSSGAAVHSVSALKCPFMINDNNEEFADEA